MMLTNKKLEAFILLLFQISTVALLLGRGWQFIFKSTPFNSFFFHPNIMNPVVEYVFQTDWKDYLTNPKWGNHYDYFFNGVGIYLWISIFVILFIRQIPSWITAINLWSLSFILVFLSFCYFIDKGLQVGQFIEHFLQFSSPLFLYYWFFKHLTPPTLPKEEEVDTNSSPSGRVFSHKKLILFLKIATALTFIGHGLYAIGYYPRPGKFIDMMIKGFGTTEDQSILFLNIVGYLDIIAALALFIPWKKVQKIALSYIIIWGFLTALARMYSNINWNMGWYSIKQWMPEFLMRFPHFLLPLVLFILLFQTQIHKGR